MNYQNFCEKLEYHELTEIIKNYYISFNEKELTLWLQKIYDDGNHFFTIHLISGRYKHIDLLELLDHKKENYNKLLEELKEYIISFIDQTDIKDIKDKKNRLIIETVINSREWLNKKFDKDIKNLIYEKIKM